MRFKFIYLLVIAFVAMTSYCLAQKYTSFGARATILQTASPGNIYTPYAQITGGRRIAAEFGLYAKRHFSDVWAIRAGLDLGLMDWDFTYTTALELIGTGPDSGPASLNYNEENYVYNALSPALVRTFRLKNKSYFELSAGPSIRYYWHGLDSTGYSRWFNLPGSYNPKNPHTEPPDLKLEFMSTKRSLYVGIPLEINYGMRFINKSTISFGLTKYLPLRQIDGYVALRARDGSITAGRFQPKANYIGFTVQVER